MFLVITHFVFHCIIDAAKPSVCFYSGFFLIRFIIPNILKNTTIDSFANDFCDKYKATLPKRTQFVTAIKVSLGDSFN